MTDLSSNLTVNAREADVIIVFCECQPLQDSNWGVPASESDQMATRAFWKSSDLVFQEPSVWTFAENDPWTKPERSKVEAHKICFPCTTKNTYELKKVKKKKCEGKLLWKRTWKKCRALQFSDPMFELLSKLEKKFWMQRFKSMNTMLDQHYHEWLLNTFRQEVEQVVEHTSLSAQVWITLCHFSTNCFEKTSEANGWEWTM